MECVYRRHPGLSYPCHVQEGSKQVPGHLELARVLLEHSADVNAQDDEKHTTSGWEWEWHRCESRKDNRTRLLVHRANRAKGEEDAWPMEGAGASLDINNRI